MVEQHTARGREFWDTRGLPRAGRSYGLGIAIYSDGADLSDMMAAYRSAAVDGFTTNPTLMSRAGVEDYGAFARKALAAIPDLPISFEAFADDFDELAAQAREIGSWGENVFIKIPICNTRGHSAVPLIRALSDEGLKINATAMMKLDQVRAVAAAVPPETPAILSVFAGRIADTARDPMPVMREAAEVIADRPNLRLLWASPREVLNIYQAEACGCDIITLTSDLRAKLELRGKDLDEFSRETVRMFYDDALQAGYTI